MSLHRQQERHPRRFEPLEEVNTTKADQSLSRLTQILECLFLGRSRLWVGGRAFVVSQPVARQVQFFDNLLNFGRIEASRTAGQDQRSGSSVGVRENRSVYHP